MGDTNYVGSIVKILENPIQKVFSDIVIKTEFRAQLPQVRNQKGQIVNLVFWGNLARDVKNYYRVNDYIMIEGYLAIRDTKAVKLIKETPKTIYITSLKIYPLL